MDSKTPSLPPQQPDIPRGIPCPRCGCCHASNVESTRHHANMTRRHRRCRNCGKLFWTRELTER